MKKEELLEIGLTDEQADKVFALNGKPLMPNVQIVGYS